MEEVGKRRISDFSKFCSIEKAIYNAMNNQPIKPVKRRGIKLGKFSFVHSSSGFVVSKEKNPYHLTICFNNLKNCFDVHLKNEKNNGYETIFIISYENLLKLYEETSQKSVQFFLKSIKLVRPGLLRRHRYYVYYKAENEIIETFKNHSPCIRSKYRPKIQKIMGHLVKDWATYYPSILHKLILDEKVEYVYAYKFGNRNNILLLIKLASRGKLQWYSISLNKIQEFMKGFWGSEIKSTIKSKFQSINQLMDFDELEDFFKLDKRNIFSSN
jgi:hypothetical protein